MCRNTAISINYYYLICGVWLLSRMQIDRLYQWKSVPDGPVRDAFKRQKEHVMKEFDDRSSQVFLQLNEQVSCSSP
jgi:translation initiation factor 5B